MNKQPPSKPIWPESGLGLLSVRKDGFLDVTDDFIRGYLAGPQLELIPESCAEERSLHGALMDDPWMVVPPEWTDKLADPDARENYLVILAYRDRLADAGTIEGAYLSAFTEGQVRVPAMFINHMTQVIVEHLLAGSDNPYMARAAEFFFREQMVNVHHDTMLSADIETAAILSEQDSGLGSLGDSLTKSGIALRSSQLDVMGAENASQYWGRSEKYDFVMDLSFERPGLDGLCRMMERWMKHLLMTEVRISALQEINDENWLWHTGLDTESTRLLNDLYDNKDVDAVRMARLISLFRLEFCDATAVQSDLAGRPVYLGMAMDENRRLRFKPQNLLFNMPLASSPTSPKPH